MFKMGGKTEDVKSAHTLGHNASQDTTALRRKISKQAKKTQNSINILSHEIEVLSKQLNVVIAKRKQKLNKQPNNTK